MKWRTISKFKFLYYEDDIRFHICSRSKFDKTIQFYASRLLTGNEKNKSWTFIYIFNNDTQILSNIIDIGKTIDT